MPSVAELLEREGTTVDLERGHFERLLRRRDRKRRNQRIGAGVLAIVLALLSFVAVTRAFSDAERPADPTPTPTDTALRRNGEIITYADDDARDLADLVALDPDTGEVRTLVAAGALGQLKRYHIGSAAWSADGRWVAIEVLGCGPRIPTAGLWVTNGQDEPRQFTRPCFEDPDLGPFNEVWAWSAAGAQLVVARRGSIDGDSLVLMDPATGDRTDLGDTEGHVASLAWSPDGTRIAYGTRRGSVYSVGVGGGEHSLLASSLGYVAGGDFGSGFGIQWSPDGEHIAVQAGHIRDAYGVDTLFVMNADGSDMHQLAEDHEVQSVHFSPNLSWSPDGTRMAYATFSGGGDERQMQIWTGSPDGSAPSLLLESAPAPFAFDYGGSPVWSPDGTRIAFGSTTTDGAAVWLVANADGTGDAREIDELRYLSWRGGWYFCGCYG